LLPGALAHGFDGAPGARPDRDAAESSREQLALVVERVLRKVRDFSSLVTLAAWSVLFGRYSSVSW